MQRYRSGHNEAVLKTVCPRGHVGSNPTLCAIVALATIFIAYQAIYELWQINSNATLKILIKMVRFWPWVLEIQNKNQVKIWKANVFWTESKEVSGTCTRTVTGRATSKVLRTFRHLTWEFDPGSGWTLAACLTHASRTECKRWRDLGQFLFTLSGGRVSNAWVTCRMQGDNSWKRLLIPHKRTGPHGLVWKDLSAYDGPASD